MFRILSANCLAAAVLLTLSAPAIAEVTSKASGRVQKARVARDAQKGRKNSYDFERGGYGAPGRYRGWRPDPPPPDADHARYPDVEKAMREAPSLPPEPFPYRGRDRAIKAGRSILKRVPTFINFRATIPLSTWRIDPAYEWRVRPARQCFADLRRQKIRFAPWRPEPVEAGSDEEEETLDPTPAPVYIRAPIEGVHFRSGRGNKLLISCELAARLRVVAEIVARHGVDQVVVVSAYRPRPRTSFHTMGLALDIMRFHSTEPLRGPNGEGDVSQWLSVFTDFLETPEIETCDPSLFGPDSPLGDNERGRRLLAIACDLHRSGIFATVLTPNYNIGHRDHFHVDVRPDDPRIFLR